MKKSNLTRIAFVLLLSLFAISCSNKTTTKEEPAAEEIVDKTGPEYTSAYICPMHCEGSGSAEEGTCPKCGMPYEANKEYKAAGSEETADEGQGEESSEVGDMEDDQDGDGHDHEGHDH